MNRQTKRLHKKCISTKVLKGVNGTGEKDNPQLAFKSFPFGHQTRKKAKREKLSSFAKRIVDAFDGVE